MDKLGNLWVKSSEMMDKLGEDNQNLMSLKEELEATLGQLFAIEQELTKQKLNFESLFRYAHDAVVMFDHEHNVIDVNNQFIRMFGHTLDAMRGKNLDLFVMPENRLGEAQKITKQVFEGSRVVTEGVRYSKSGAAIDVAIQGVPMMLDGAIVGGFGIYTDISERKSRERELAYASCHDHLTKLYNRRYFDQMLIEYRESGSMPLGLIMMDINGLKLINDAFGHDVGDKLLLKVAESLAPYDYDGNIIARIGSDEYGILCPDVTSELMENMSRQLKKQFSDLKINGVAISTSVGWAIQFDKDESARMLIKTAEDYMNRNKLFAAPSIRGNAVYAIVNTLHEKNEREEQHSRRVGALSLRLGEMLGLSARELSELRAMGTLHDIGKVAIDENILNKPGKLTREEYDEIKRHPEIGYRILSSVNELGEIAEYVLSHHESWDGSGYPRGLVGLKIPFLSRVIAIADAYDAMTSKRSYREAVGKEKALEELVRCAGKQFDPEIVKVFVSKIDYIE